MELSNRAVSKAGAGALSVLKADVCLVCDPCSASLLFALPPKQPANVPSMTSRGRLTPVMVMGGTFPLVSCMCKQIERHLPAAKALLPYLQCSQGCREQREGKYDRARSGTAQKASQLRVSSEQVCTKLR